MSAYTDCAAAGDLESHQRVAQVQCSLTAAHAQTDARYLLPLPRLFLPAPPLVLIPGTYALPFLMRMLTLPAIRVPGTLLMEGTGTFPMAITAHGGR